jgi:hypothetical protein
MFLSAGVLTEDEREEAFAAVPDMEPLRFNRNISLNLIDGEALKTIDGLDCILTAENLTFRGGRAGLRVRCRDGFESRSVGWGFRNANQEFRIEGARISLQG